MAKSTKTTTLIGILLLGLTAQAAPEAWYAEKAHETFGGKLEVRLEDGSRVDLLTETYAFEIEKSYNWKEAVGRALHYAKLTGHRAGIILILEHMSADKYLERLKELIAEYELPIEIFPIRAQAETKS